MHSDSKGLILVLHIAVLLFVFGLINDFNQSVLLSPLLFMIIGDCQFQNSFLNVFKINQLHEKSRPPS
ncbi:MAG: hypothetical protein DWP95_05815 [Proteobacteria bacterium]|nr:MAG: hypothetical protein DWP95_05815 [Pseudomonadota bacterium]